MNSICIMGRIANDLELKTTTNGTSVLNFNVAVPRPHVKETTDFIKCVAWRSTAEFINNYFHKGKMIAIQGFLTIRSWKDDNGNNHSVSEVMVERIYFCGDKAKDLSNEEQPTPSEFEAIEEDIPF